MLIELCPNRSATALMCTPASSHATAALCRSVCAVYLGDLKWRIQPLLVRGFHQALDDGAADEILDSLRSAQNGQQHTDSTGISLLTRISPLTCNDGRTPGRT